MSTLLTPALGPRRGRPKGRRTTLTASMAVLRAHHFHFLRARLNGIELRPAWERYLAAIGATDDLRHFANLERQLQRAVRRAAGARGLTAQVDLALGPDTRGSLAALPSPARPTLDEWIAERCERLGIDGDFQSQAEWLAEYEDEFGLDQVEQPQGAVAHAEAAESASVAERLAALDQLARSLVQAPSLDDGLEAWLAEGLAGRLRSVGLRTVRNLIDYVNIHGHRWHRHVDGLGAARAAALLVWLDPLAQSLGHPVRELARVSASRLALRPPTPGSALEPARLGLVPLHRLRVPQELDGRHGVFRVQGPNVLGAETDFEAIRLWLERYRNTARTYVAYARAVERFYLFCLLQRGKALSSVVEEDLQAYRRFLGAPPADWVQTRSVGRDSPDWRPFRGPLSPLSQRHAFTVLSALFSGLVSAGYLSVNAARGVTPLLKLPRARVNIRRTFDEAQWAWILEVWAALYREAGPKTQPKALDLPWIAAHSGPENSPLRAATLRRTRLILELASTTGLRLIELATARLGGLRQEWIAGQSTWMLDVTGKGQRDRSVIVFDDVKALIDRHQQDLAERALPPSPRSPVRGVAQPGPGVRGAPGFEPGADPTPSPAPADGRPLIGALRPPVPRWTVDTRGVPQLDRAPRRADRYGALETSALYQSLKRLFQEAAARASAAPAGVDAEGLTAASTHWLRHFFANSAAADGVLPVALMGVMGHASLQTTSLYTHPEEELLALEMRKLRRRA